MVMTNVSCGTIDNCSGVWSCKIILSSLFLCLNDWLLEELIHIEFFCGKS